MKKFLKELKYYNRNISTIAILAVLIIFIFSISKIKEFLSFYNLIMVFAVIFSLIFHEIGHSLSAYICGDNTSKLYGRLSLNPFKHLDLLGTLFPILMILIGANGLVFGWAKPVLINYRKLKWGRFGEFLVSFSGIFINFLLAFFIILTLKFIIPKFSSQISISYTMILMKIFFINLSLGVFNLLPIPPLDGSRILASISPNSIRQAIFQVEKYGIIIILFLSYTGLLDKYMEDMIELIFKFFYIFS